MALSYCLPNFVIAGAPKSGTSSLHSWIADHPDALGSKEKETYFFVDPGSHMYRPSRHIAHGLDGYMKYFPHSSQARPRIVLESTPTYMYYETARLHLPKIPSDPKFLFVLREPAAFLYSLFTYFKNNWTWIPPNLSFPDYIAMVRAGTGRFKGNEIAENSLHFASYVDFLEPWLRVLGPDRMQVRLFDEMVRDEKEFTKDVARWLGLESSFYDSYSFPRDNETYSVRAHFLQQINVAVRGSLPKGGLYRALRKVYRQVNTAGAKEMAPADLEIMGELRGQYRVSNRRLSDSFGVNIDAWEK
jgi:hypothetical protein